MFGAGRALRAASCPPVTFQPRQGWQRPQRHFRERSRGPRLRSSSVHDEREIEAVLEVLRSGPQGRWPGRRVTAMDKRQVAALFGKAAGVMVNSGSSALFLAVELLGLEPGTEVLTCGLTFSTDISGDCSGRPGAGAGRL